MDRYEADLKRKLAIVLRTMPGYVVIRHEDRFTSGVPDFSATGPVYDEQGHILGRTTTWLEAKLLVPGQKSSRTAQDVKCAQLEKAGRCAHVVWFGEGTDKTTVIASPALVMKAKGDPKELLAILRANKDKYIARGRWACGRWDHNLVAEWVRNGGAE